MNENIESLASESLRQIAPDIDIETVDPDADLREQFDIDSMDFLNLVTRLAKQLNIHIPESDYPKIETYRALVDYLVSQTDASSTTS